MVNPDQDAIQAALTHFLNSLPETIHRIVVGLSGGQDSCVLLHALCHHPERYKLSIEAIHINHGLHQASAEWASYCRQYCEQLGVQCAIEAVAPSEHFPDGVEAWARTQRYRIFKQHLAKQDALLLAHHQQDQAETVLLNLMRGSGPAGLSGMPASRRLGTSQLYRPLLSVSKAAIEQYASIHSIVWIDDPSNQDTEIKRNYIRHQILPALAECWPDAIAQIHRAASHCTDAERLCQQWAQEQLAQLWHGEGDQSLDIYALLAMPVSQQRYVLRYWFAQVAGEGLSFQSVHTLLDEVCVASEDAMPQLQVGRWMCWRFKGRLYVTPAELMAPVEPFEIAWDGQGDLQVPGWPEPITRANLSEQGLDVNTVDWSIVSIRSRQGGELCQLVGHQHHKSLKKLYQEREIPPWKRDKMPLLYEGDCLLAVIGGWLCQR